MPARSSLSPIAVANASMPAARTGAAASSSTQIRRARSAQLVVANHALVMTQAAWGGLDDATVPTRYVFDEGHHLFEAADAAFAAVLSGLGTAESHRWVARCRGRALPGTRPPAPVG